jgi:hypothetical protein
MMSDMENRDWINEFEALKKVSASNPFSVPSGYFDSLDERIMSVKNLDELKNNQPSDGFSVPENYFDELTNNIQSCVALEQYKNEEQAFLIPENYFDELTNNIESRIVLEQYKNEEHVFSVPENYFGDLEDNIQSRIALEEYKNEKVEFSVPEGYFESLSQQIQSRIAIEETVVSSEESLTVPEGYFEKLNQDILNKTVNFNPLVVKKPKGIVRKLFASTAFKYATAACFALAVGGGILITSKLTDPAYVHTHSFLHQQLSTVSVNELKNYIEMGIDAGETQNMILTNGAPIDSVKLKNDLQDYLDSVQ